MMKKQIFSPQLARILPESLRLNSEYSAAGMGRKTTGISGTVWISSPFFI
jgi:hypothetical protein